MDLPVEQLARSPVEGLYVHVPFCRRRCDYCDFYSMVLDPARAAEFVDAAIAELAFWKERLDWSAARTIFIGGGTPTALPAEALNRLIEAVGQGVPTVSEFTIEANPATVDAELARRLRQHGVNRISFGVQSFDAGELKTLGRIHSPAEAAESVRIARAAGFGNINLDLIYGIPGQTLDSWQRSLEAAVALGVEHLSCYGLTYEPGTPFAQRREGGLVQPLDDETTVAMYRLAGSALAAAGFEHYEISNWAKPGFGCRHNLLYWHNRPWLGIGPSAAGYVGGFRFKGPADLRRYVEAATGGEPEYSDVERLTGRAAAGEAAMLGLRLREGIEPAEFAVRHGVDVRELGNPPGLAVRRHVELGLLAWRDGRLRLTERALPVSDSVLVDFLEEQESAVA